MKKNTIIRLRSISHSVLENKTEEIKEEVKFHKYGFKKDVNDTRDFKYKATSSINKVFPSKLDLRFNEIAIYDQGDLGSCTGNAIAYIVQYDLFKNKNVLFTPSRLFIYYNERKLENTIYEDSGATIRNGIKTINVNGVCDECLWQYDTTKFTHQPSNNAYEQSQLCKSLSYFRVEQTMNDIKDALNNNFPIAYGFMIYESFETGTVKKDGLMDFPDISKEKCLGGHAVVCIGYDDTITFKNQTKGGFIIRNSWGNKWGIDGHFYMPYNYMLNPAMATDFWVIKSITKINEREMNKEFLEEIRDKLNGITLQLNKYIESKNKN